MARAPYASIGVVHTSPSSTSVGAFTCDACTSTHDIAHVISCAAERIAPHITLPPAVRVVVRTAMRLTTRRSAAKRCVSEAVARAALTCVIGARTPRAMFPCEKIRDGVISVVRALVTYMVVFVVFVVFAFVFVFVEDVILRGGLMSNPSSVATSGIQCSCTTRASSATPRGHAHDAREELAAAADDDADDVRGAGRTAASAAGTRAAGHQWSSSCRRRCCKTPSAR